MVAKVRKYEMQSTSRVVALGTALFGAWGCGDSEAAPEDAMNGAIGGSGSKPNATLTDVVAISAGYHHSCAIRSDGSVVCWGDNTNGGLGNGAAMTPGIVNRSGIPVQVSGISDAATISAGQGYTCAVLDSGRVQCWGANEVGQLGNGTGTSSSVPVDVVGIDDAVDVTTGGYHACALDGSGSIMFGPNEPGSRRRNDEPRPPFPVNVPGLSAVIAISSGGVTGGHTCAITAEPKRLLLGHELPWTARERRPFWRVYVQQARHLSRCQAVTGAIRVDAGDDSTCATTVGGDLFCWGTGNLGDGASSTNSLPLEVTDVVSAGEVSVGSSQICVRLQVGTVGVLGL